MTSLARYCKLCAYGGWPERVAKDDSFRRAVLGSFVGGVMLSPAERAYYCSSCLALLLELAAQWIRSNAPAPVARGLAPALPAKRRAKR